MKKIMKKLNKKGFTLAELLIVVAIIAVLVAISIPIFTAQLEKSREAVDLANIRAAYAECATDILTEDTATIDTVYKQVDPVQTTSGWNTTFDEVAGIEKANVPDIVKGTPVYVIVTADTTATDPASISATAPTGKVKKLD